MSITVQQLADGLNITVERLRQITGRDSLVPNMRVTPEYARELRDQVRDRTSETGKPASGLTLETYVPNPLVISAIEGAGEAIRRSERTLAEAVTAIFVVNAVTFDDLVAQGVAPFASSPGVMNEPSEAGANALADWVIDRVNAAMLQAVIRNAFGGGRNALIITKILSGDS